MCKRRKCGPRRSAAAIRRRWKEHRQKRVPPGALLARFDKADAEFNRLLTDVRNRGAWDDTFVDALCDPPETFTFGGMFAHVITFNAFRRLTALDALRRLGVNVEGFGCPMEYELSIAPWRTEQSGTPQ